MAFRFKKWIISLPRKNAWNLSPKGRWSFKVLTMTRYSSKFILGIEIYCFAKYNRNPYKFPERISVNPYLDGSEPISDIPKAIQIHLGLIKIRYRPLRDKNVSK